MNLYALVLIYVTGYSSSMTTVQGFDSAQSCKDARKEIEQSFSHARIPISKYLYSSCVKIK